MNKLFKKILFISILLCFSYHLKAQDKPNIIVFIADDAGWRDFGCYGNEAIKTPNIDQLSQGGLTCREAFLTVPQCSPSRISILSGKFAHTTRTEDLHTPLPPEEEFVTTYLQVAGYFTGHMRKTHYGPNGIKQFNWYSNEFGDFPKFLDETNGKPFFMWVGFIDPHRAYQEGAIDEPHDPAEVMVPPYLADREGTRKDRALYYDEISRMDKNIGIMVDELKNRGLYQNTLIVFLSDNGSPFPRAKGTLYDEGIKTPLIFHWQGKIKSGTEYSELVSVIDLSPTFLDLAGINKPLDMVGESIQPIFYNQDVSGREFVFSERNWHDNDEHMRSIRSEKYKLITNAYQELPLGTPADCSSSLSWYDLLDLKNKGELSEEQRLLFTVPRPRIEFYNIENDPWEFNNLAGTPEVAGEIWNMVKELEDWRKATDDFSPLERRRDDHTDRVTGVRFGVDVPELKSMVDE